MRNTAFFAGSPIFSRGTPANIFGVAIAAAHYRGGIEAFKPGIGEVAILAAVRPVPVTAGRFAFGFALVAAIGGAVAAVFAGAAVSVTAFGAYPIRIAGANITKSITNLVVAVYRH